MPYASVSPEEADTRPRPGAAQRPPGELLSQAAQLAEQAQLVVEKAVITERAKGTSWEVIGEILGGVSKSAAQKRWGTAVARWRESADIDPRKLPPFVPDDLAEFSVAYDELDGAWKQATEIVDRQPLLADLNNATVALSGSPGVHTGTGSQHNHYFRAARLCEGEPDSRQTDEVMSLLEAASRAQHDRGLDVVRLLGALAIRASHSAEEWRDNPENTNREQEPRASAAMGGKYRRDYSRKSRRRNLARAQDEFRASQQGLTLEERVTRLECAFEDLLADEPVGP